MTDYYRYNNNGQNHIGNMSHNFDNAWSFFLEPWGVIIGALEVTLGPLGGFRREDGP